MTEPTQAQIEDVWRNRYLFAKGIYEKEIKELKEKIAALTAAAEVDSFVRHSVDFQEGIAEGRAAEREACAQVADVKAELGRGWDRATAQAIAAAIRASGEK